MNPVHIVLTVAAAVFVVGALVHLHRSGKTISIPGVSPAQTSSAARLKAAWDAIEDEADHLAARLHAEAMATHIAKEKRTRIAEAISPKAPPEGTPPASPGATA